MHGVQKWKQAQKTEDQVTSLSFVDQERMLKGDDGQIT